jgi:regulator of RNase E activity RraB
VTRGLDGDAPVERWGVQGSTNLTTISKSILDQRVEWMVAAGMDHDCEFDGWGTQV